jgi:hypothetical protein
MTNTNQHFLENAVNVINDLLLNDQGTAEYRMGMIHAFEMITFNPKVHLGIKFLSDEDSTRRTYFIITD